MSQLCHSIMKRNPSNLVMSWYNEVTKLAKNEDIKYLKVVKGPRITSARSSQTLVGDYMDGFQFELSLWYRTWNVSKIGMVGGGLVWGFYEGGGMVYNGGIGEELVYVYPDGETCMVGKWEKGRLVETREDQIKKVDF